MKWILVRDNLNRGLRMHWQFTLYKVAWFSSQSHFTYYGLMLYKLRKTSQEMEDLLRELEDDIIIKSEDVILNYFYIIRCYYFFIIQWRQSMDYIFWNFRIFILHNNVSLWQSPKSHIFGDLSSDKSKKLMGRILSRQGLEKIEHFRIW